VRKTALFTLLAVSAAAQADHLIDIPIARKIAIGEFRLDAQVEASKGRTQRYFVGTGLTQNIDAELRAERFEGGKTVGTVDLSYNFQPAIVDYSPGISVGVQDALDQTREGWRAYVATTFRTGLITSGTNAHADTTLGIKAGRRTRPFVGVDLPFLDQVHGLVEHNGYRLAAGFDLRPVPSFGIRAIFEAKNTILSAVFTHKF